METALATGVQLPALRPFDGASLQKYLDRALAVLDKFGLTKGTAETNELGVLLEDLKDLDENRVLAIANVVQYNSSFNKLVSEKLSTVRPSDRFITLKDDFDGIRSESKVLLEQLADGKISFFERMRNRVMAAKDGDIPTRFEHIKTVFKEVTSESRNRIKQVGEICEAYEDFRSTLLRTKVYAIELRELQEGNLATAKKGLDAATATFAAETDDIKKADLQVALHDARRKYDVEDRRYRLLTTIAQEMEISYAATDSIFQSVAQMRIVDEALYDKSVIFFRANESTITALAVAYEQQRGVQEQAKSTKALEDGINAALEDLATSSTAAKKEAVEIAFGVSLTAESIGKLIDSTVAFQEDFGRMRAEYTAKADENVAQVRKKYEDGLVRLNAAIQGYRAPETSVEAKPQA